MENAPKLISAKTLNEWLNSDRDKPTIIDVREKLELDIVRFPFTNIHIPISQVSVTTVSEELQNLINQEIVVLCHMGIRSYNFGQWLLDNQFVNEVWNLEEGIDGWSRYIDCNLTRY